MEESRKSAREKDLPNGERKTEDAGDPPIAVRLLVKDL
jgi:hypothetical protein